MKAIFRCPRCNNILAQEAAFPQNGFCEKCGFCIHSIERIPLLVKNFDEIASLISKAKEDGRRQWYEASQTVYRQGYYRHHIRKRKEYLENVVKSFLTRHSQKEMFGLDIGCGDGADIEWLSGYFSELYASDYNIIRLKRAVEKYSKANIFMADIADFPVVDNAFDFILCNHVLEHIPDDEAVLKEIFRILAPGGLVVLGVPNEGAFFWRLAYALQSRFRRTSDHAHFYTSRSLQRKCLQTGFLIEELHYIGWGIPHWSLDAKLRQYKLCDDILERVGRRLFRTQATSLYLLLSK